MSIQPVHDEAWKIFYGDGTTFASSQGPPESAPSLNVQAIAERDERAGRLVLSRFDYYIHTDKGWFGVDLFGLFDWLMTNGIVKFGRTIDNDSYSRIIHHATHDPDLPPKTSVSNRERKNPNLPD